MKIERDAEIFNMIKIALERATKQSRGPEITEETHLLNSEILDSLDSLVFLMELENIVGVNLTESDENLSDDLFKVSELIKYVKNR